MVDRYGARPPAAPPISSWPRGAGRSVEFHHRKPGTGWRWEPRPISANDTRNGAIYDLWIG
ncbi:hypothetical protein [Streptomyces scabiei]|uniref:hypothetical protein n=1 Tax=Streptomyces scabiei TaxID=1930 RepID=UPI000765B66B|nr:hypothetical protein [Streptomyces scabiei]